MMVARTLRLRPKAGKLVFQLCSLEDVKFSKKNKRTVVPIAPHCGVY
jgi:hypothetical protein